MSELRFELLSSYGHGMNPQKTLPLDNNALVAYKQKLTQQLAKYIDRINACGGYIAITVEQDGQTFTSQPLGFQDEALFRQIIDGQDSI